MNKIIRFPTILGILLLLATTIGTYSLLNRPAIFSSKASGDCSPTDIQISNVTHQQVNISFTTSASCEAQVALNNKTYKDVRTLIDPKISALKTHYFELSQLSADTSYNYSIIVGGQRLDNQKFKTAATPSPPEPQANLSWGKVIHSDHTPASGSVVMMALPGAGLLSALVTTNGNWHIPMALAFDAGLTRRFAFSQEPLDVEIIVFNEKYSSPTVVSLSTALVNPISDIILNQGLAENTTQSLPQGDLGDVEEQLTSSPTEQPVAQNYQITVSNPNENETIETTAPEFFGLGPKNAKLTILLESINPQNGEVTTTSDGNWRWSPQQNIEPGSHTLTISYIDPITKSIKSIQRKFHVNAAAAISTPIPQPNVGGDDIAPAFVSTPSAATPTLEPTPTERTFRPTDVPPPVTGNGSFTVLLVIFALFSVASSYALIRSNN